MLDPWIIDEIRRREREERQEENQPVIELPLDRPARPPQPTSHIDGGAPTTGERGVVILDYSI